MNTPFNIEGVNLHEIMGDKHITRIPCKLPMWKVAENTWSRDYGQKKLTLFSTICREFSNLYLVYDDKPTEWGIVGDWDQVRQDTSQIPSHKWSVIKRSVEICINTWKIPANVDVNQLYDWLGPGLWTIYAANKPVSLPISAGPNLEHWVPIIERERIQVLIYADFDNEPWDIIFNPHVQI